MTIFGQKKQKSPTFSTYSISIVGQTPPASPTDLFIMSGSSSKVVKIISVNFWAWDDLVGTPQYPYDLYIIKRSTDDTGGTSTNQLSNIISFDSNNSASTINVMRSYTANPSSLGTGAGTFKYLKALEFTDRSYSTAANPNPQIVIHPYSQPVTLRGTSEFLAININGVSFTASPVWSLHLVWAEV